MDYRSLNAVMRKDYFPLPWIDDALDYAAGSQGFSSLDLKIDYWQVELAKEDRSKTAFGIEQRLWQFTIMPFGLCYAPATFEQLMERVLWNIPHSSCVLYLDHLLVHALDFVTAVSLDSYYRKFIRDFATMAAPLHQLTRKGQQFDWTRGGIAAF